jgi:hypothetical protein
MILAHENKCPMCGKEVIISGEHDNKNDKPEENDSISSVIAIEQIDGTYYTFDTANCALMFKKFKAVYGSNFPDEL